MRDKNRIEPLLKRLQEAWSKNPDLRLGQLLLNAMSRLPEGQDLFYVEDDKIIEAIELLLKK